MIVILGLVILVVAAIVGVAGVLGNAGTAHALTHDFSVFGYHVTGSTGSLFLFGLVVGAVAMLGLALLLTGARRTSRRGSAARRELERSRRDTAVVTRQRDDLVDQRAAARAYRADDPLNRSPISDRLQNPLEARQTYQAAADEVTTLATPRGTAD